MSKRTFWRPFIASLVLVMTIVLFANYFHEHPGVRHQLSLINPWVIALLFGLYTGFLAALSLVNIASLRLCRAVISQGESLLLTTYSMIINFFGPLQSGPAFRALYLKKKHGVKIKDYTLASFVYYFFYALFSGLLLLSGILKWWLIPIAAAILLILQVMKKSPPSPLKALNRLSTKHWYYMAFATFVQISFVVAIYYAELKSVAPATSFSQALIYTGAANFALFVSITPGAIGFRESFLLFSENLHHINANTIVAANALDRAVYVVFLIILAIILGATHARGRLKSVTQT